MRIIKFNSSFFKNIRKYNK